MRSSYSWPLFINLKNLKIMTNVQNKLEEARKEKVTYDFLTPVSEYIDKTYGEIKDQLTNMDYKEIIREIQENNDVVVNKKNYLYVINNKDVISFKIALKKDSKEIEQIKADIRATSLMYLDRHYMYTYLSDINLNDFYYVTDWDKYYNFILELNDKRLESRLEDIKKEETERKENLQKDLNDAKEFGIFIQDRESLEKYRKARILKNKDTELKDIVKLVEDIKNDIEIHASIW
jgi:hypothetical protein